MKLKRFHFDIKNLNGSNIVIVGQDAIHIKSVMRLKVNDEIIAVCGDGKDYHSKIIDIQNEKIVCQILNISNNQADAKINVTLYQALLKADKLDLVVQKATELGIKNITLFESEFCVAKWQGNNNKIDRLNKISLEATKQCGRSEPINIKAGYRFNDIVNELKNYDCVIFAYENAQDLRISDIKGEFENIAIIIGSEGGFSQSESNDLVSKENVYCVSLGKRVLRAETASIVASAIVMEHFEK